MHRARVTAGRDHPQHHKYHRVAHEIKMHGCRGAGRSTAQRPLRVMRRYCRFRSAAMSHEVNKPKVKRTMSHMHRNRLQLPSSIYLSVGRAQSCVDLVIGSGYRPWLVSLKPPEHDVAARSIQALHMFAQLGIPWRGRLIDVISRSSGSCLHPRQAHLHARAGHTVCPPPSQGLHYLLSNERATGDLACMYADATELGDMYLLNGHLGCGKSAFRCESVRNLGHNQVRPCWQFW
jgi:hypothetical protein